MGRINKKLKASGNGGSSASSLKQSLKDRMKNDDKKSATQPQQNNKQKQKDETLLMLKKPAFKGIMKKKDRIKMKRENLNSKLKTAEAAKIELKDKKKREKAPIVGDMKPMTDTLAVLDQLLQEDDEVKAKMPKTGKKRISKGTKKLRARERQFKNDLVIFAQIAKHDMFKSDPFGTIGTHIENKALADANEDE